MTLYTDMLIAPVDRLVEPASVVCPATASCEEVVRRMADLASGCAVVTRDDGQVLDAVTHADVVQRMAYQVPADRPVVEVLSGNPCVLTAAEPLYGALAVLRDRGRSHAPVVDGQGQLVGVVSWERLSGTAMPAGLRRLEAVTPALVGLREGMRGQPEVVGALLEDGVDAPALQRLLAGFNDETHRRVTDSAVDSLRRDGWGEPPVRFAVLLMGSGGRRESLLGPDQDNGMVIADYPDRVHTAVDRYFAELAARMTRELDAVGIPLCPGHVMATNPVWRKTVSQWRAQIRGWVRTRSARALLQAHVLVDVRGVCGDLALAEALRHNLQDELRRTRTFVQALTVGEASVRTSALGWFDRLRTEASGLRAGEFNVKRDGLAPIVEAVRLCALAHHVAETGTLARLERLRAVGAISVDQEDIVRRAYSLLAETLLRQQLADVAAGRSPGHHVAPDRLRARDHELLVHSVRSSRTVLERLVSELSGGAGT